MKKINESIKQESFLLLSFTSALQMRCPPLEAKSNHPISVLILPDSQAAFEELISPVLDMCSSLGCKETTILLVAPFHLLADSSSCSQFPHFWGTQGSALNPLLCFFTHTHSLDDFIKVPDCWLLKSCLEPTVWTPPLLSQSVYPTTYL